MPKRDKTWNKGQGHDVVKVVVKNDETKMTARAIVKDDETEKTVLALALPCQDEMTDLDLEEMTDLFPKIWPILNTSRGTYSVPWTVCVWEARRLSGLFDTVRKLLEHLLKVHGITHHQGARHLNVQRLQPVPRPSHELRVRREGLVVHHDLLPRDRKAAKTRRTRRTRPRKSKRGQRY